MWDHAILLIPWCNPNIYSLIRIYNWGHHKQLLLSYLMRRTSPYTSPTVLPVLLIWGNSMHSWSVRRVVSSPSLDWGGAQWLYFSPILFMWIAISLYYCTSTYHAYPCWIYKVVFVVIQYVVISPVGVELTGNQIHLHLVDALNII